MTYPIPKFEEKRLQILEELDILDSPEDEVFDRLAQIAYSYFEVSMVLITLIDKNRQWFKSEIGLGLKETEREISFCTYTILDHKGLVIENTNDDPRFMNNPLVKGPPNVKFYAGFPIHYPILNGDMKYVNLGSFAILDRKPRNLTHGQELMLSNFANLLSQLLFKKGSKIQDFTLQTEKDTIIFCSWCKELNNLEEDSLANLLKQFSDYFNVSHTICNNCSRELNHSMQAE